MSKPVFIEAEVVFTEQADIKTTNILIPLDAIDYVVNHKAPDGTPVLKVIFKKDRLVDIKTYTTFISQKDIEVLPLRS